MKRIVLFSMVTLALAGQPVAFEILKEGGQIPRIEIAGGENSAVALAVDDLRSDLGRIAGQPVSPTLSAKILVGEISGIDFAADGDFAGLEGLKAELEGKWEAYRIREHKGNLYLIGSDTRGTLWAIYRFIEECLGVDPMYLWTGKPVEKRDSLSLQNVSIASDGPSFQFRGWFINDEDFLTEWQQFEGRRNNDYKYYARIMHPDVTDRIIETVLRLRMNLIIPSSFNDIFNPPEAYAIDQAVKRGLLVTQHHIEPLGVGGFNFDDYFIKQGKEPPLFSFLEHPDEMKEVWEHYVKEWSKRPGAIWQLGLRGRGDRAIWVHDPSIPKDDASRGRIISDAIRYQYDLVRKHDPGAIMTLTLWLEIATLMEGGHIDIPADIGLVFADNSPGWGFSPDFYRIAREPDRQYGIYYHHQLWGTGPHFIAGIPPEKTHQVIGEAVGHGSGNYCVLNVGNVREFVQGLKLSAEMLFDFEGYSNEEAQMKWFRSYFGDHADSARQVYRDFFDHYLLDTENKYRTGFTEMENSPYILDGHLAGRMKTMLMDLNSAFGLPEYSGEAWIAAGEHSDPKPLKWSDSLADWQGQVEKQKANLLPTIAAADALYREMSGHPAYFLDVNLLTPARMFYELMDMTGHTMSAVEAECRGDRKAALDWLEKALAAARKANAVKQNMLQGEWENWYRGEYKIRFSSYEEFLEHLLAGKPSG